MVLHRDFLMRQIQQLIQVLMQVLFKKQEGQHEEARTILSEGLVANFDTDLDALLAMDQSAFMELCSPSNAFHAGLAVALADLLREEPTAAAAERAYWLYEASLEKGAALSMPALGWLDDYRRTV
ncbi:MAG: hypothetical protein OXT73_09400 [Bacteroidota bacterium]|nr:hypothetical protein [Bacteroidota bacterium]